MFITGISLITLIRCMEYPNGIKSYWNYYHNGSKACIWQTLKLFQVASEKFLKIFASRFIFILEATKSTKNTYENIFLCLNSPWSVYIYYLLISVLSSFGNNLFWRADIRGTFVYLTVFPVTAWRSWSMAVVQLQINSWTEFSASLPLL